MATDISTGDALLPAITRLLEHRIAEATETVVQQAVKDFEARLRREIASTAMEVGRFYELYTNRDTVTIKVKLEGGAK